MLKRWLARCGPRSPRWSGPVSIPGLSPHVFFFYSTPPRPPAGGAPPPPFALVAVGGGPAAGFPAWSGDRSAASC